MFRKTVSQAVNRRRLSISSPLRTLGGYQQTFSYSSIPKRGLATVRPNDLLMDEQEQKETVDPFRQPASTLDPFHPKFAATNTASNSDKQGMSHHGGTAHSDSCRHEEARVDVSQQIRKFLKKTRQRARAGMKADELMVKCPSCSPGKPARLAYSAHLNTHTGSFVCTSCFEQGPWDKYVQLASRRTFKNTIPKRNAADPAPFYFAEDLLGKLQDNLVNHENIYNTLTGTEQGQLRLKPEALQEFGVALGYVNPGKKVLHKVGSLVHGNDHSVPCLVFPRTAYRTNRFIEDSELNGRRPASDKQPRHSAPLSSMLKDIADGDAGADSSGVAGESTQSEYHTVQLKIVGWNTADIEMYYPVDATQPGLFGFHIADSSGSSEVILTGHELDAVAAYQETGIPAVSLPRNAYQLPLDSMRALERFERIYVWLDDDHQGAEAARLITRKLGVDRCLTVHSRGGSPKGPKSASYALARGFDLKEMIDQARPERHDKVLDFAALREAVKFEVNNPDLIRGVESTDLPGWNSCFKGLRPGELTILSGPTGCGKTTVLSQMSLDFCKSNVSTLWGSFEIPNVRLATRMMSQLAKRDITKSPGEVEFWSQRFEQMPMYFLKFHGSTKPRTVLDTMRHAVYAYDVKHIIIDNLQFMMSMQAKGMDKYEAQDSAIATFRQFATEENVHITVVAHLRKDQPASDIDINSIFGSAKVTQEADNVVVLQKYGAAESKIRYMNVLKNRFDGTLGKIYIQYDPESLSFREIPPPRQRKNIKILATSQKMSMQDKLTQETIGIDGGSQSDIDLDAISLAKIRENEDGS